MTEKIEATVIQEKLTDKIETTETQKKLFSIEELSEFFKKLPLKSNIDSQNIKLKNKSREWRKRHYQSPRIDDVYEFTPLLKKYGGLLVTIITLIGFLLGWLIPRKFDFMVLCAPCAWLAFWGAYFYFNNSLEKIEQEFAKESQAENTHPDLSIIKYFIHKYGAFIAYPLSFFGIFLLIGYAFIKFIVFSNKYSD